MSHPTILLCSVQQHLDGLYIDADGIMIQFSIHGQDLPLFAFLSPFQRCKGTNKYVKNQIYWQFFVLSHVSPTASVRARVCAYIVGIGRKHVCHLYHVVPDGTDGTHVFCI